MSIVKKSIKYILISILLLLLLIAFYFISSIVLAKITIDRKDTSSPSITSVYLSTNGAHLDLIIPKKNIDPLVLAGIKNKEEGNYMSFGWGDENFYLNTPTWGDLTFSNGFKAAFLKSPTLLHITRYGIKQVGWIEIEVNETELKNLNMYLLNTFATDDTGNKILLESKGYYDNDDFYKAKGSYSCFKTCNTWVNSGFKESGLKSCYWSPFDSGLLDMYK